MRYFFVGIGGVSMSALAKLLRQRRNYVAGSDIIESASVKELRELGIMVYLGHKAENLRAEKIDRLVINGAIADDNPELLEARKQGIKILYRENLLATISRSYRNVIAVAGCHGKSSTTAMLGEIFKTAGLNPTIHNGVKNNLNLGNKNYFITEACEFRKSLLRLTPTIAVVTNVDADHLDCYRDLEEIKKTFIKFAAKSDILVKNAADHNSINLYGKKRTVTFGIDYGDVHAANLIELPDGSYEFDLKTNPAVFGVFYETPHLKLNVVGRHNVANVLAAVTVGLLQELDLTAIKQGVMNYHGISRRFELLKKIGRTPIVVDYAHHPREIQTTIETARKIYPNYLLIFQPHTYTRTLSLWEDFVGVLAKVPHLILYKTYAARGKTIVGGRALDLSKRLHVKYIASVKTLQQYINQHAFEYDAIILCGAGDVVSGEFLTS